MTMKVLYILSTMEQSGPNHVVYNIIRHLDTTKFQPVLLTLSPERAFTAKQSFEKLDVPIYSLDQSRLQWILRGGISLRKKVAEIAPDIIHTHSYRGDIASASLSGYIRISTVHGDLKTNYSNTYPSWLADWMAVRQINAVTRLDHAVACSSAVFSLYKGNISSWTSIHNGVDTQRYASGSDDREILRHNAGIPFDKKVFVSVGSLTERKDPSTLIEGFLQSKAADNAVLIFFGDGELLEPLKKKWSHAQGQVIFRGFVNDMAPALAVADYFVSASRSEGLPNSVLEALASGLPVCLSSINAHTEIADTSAGCATFFRPGDAKGLAASIDQLVRLPYALCSGMARKLAVEKFSAASMSKKYQDLYEKIVNGRA